MKATSGHGPGAVEDVLHCTAECGTSSASSVPAEQLLTAAMVHVFALAGFAAGIGTLWAISRACRSLHAVYRVDESRRHRCEARRRLHLRAASFRFLHKLAFGGVTLLLPLYSIVVLLLCLRVEPIILVRLRHFTKILGKRSYIIREDLWFATYPPMERNSQLENVCSDALIPSDVTCDRVGLSGLGISEKYYALTGNTKHGSALRHGTDQIAWEIGTEGNQVHYRLCVQERDCLGYLLVLPSGDATILCFGHLHCSPKMELLNGELIRQDLSQHFGLAFAPCVGKKEGQNSHKERNKRRNACHDSRDCIPVPRAHRNTSNFDNNAHSLIPCGLAGILPRA
ncbi:hypothetical protein FEO91_08705 [Stenotrophomonas maltophilia]|nr:hypothetical protein FEO91_08705 [Stenotrophomonas maltophilia]